MGALAFMTGRKLVEALADGRIYMSFTRKNPPVQGWFNWEISSVDFVFFTVVTGLLFLLAVSGAVVFTLKTFRPEFGERSEEHPSKPEPS